MLTFLLSRIVELYILVIFIYVLMSWIPQMSGWVYDLYVILGKVCDPYLNIFKKVIPTAGAIDFSPMVAVLVLIILERLIYVIL
ncbi:MAG: YggT family protein [Phoenicibacter congonensis]|uniref:YggT family protein n=1 Tax=Phoenicibacter congonensis TaxID=1944646 RepID=A0AA43U9Z3_9ACTN|nr:YggT family protein [Phoenicibacter congonensis]